MLQPRTGYRAGVDPVLLAAAVPAQAGHSVLELGCGVGVASLCLMRRVPDLHVTGLEVQPDYADLARRNATQNDLGLHVVTGDLVQMPTGLREKSYDHVIANPPYYDRQTTTRAIDAGRERSLGEDASLAHWIDAATRRLNPKGYLTVIHQASRLPDLLAACDSRLGDVRVLPFVPRKGKPAKLVILNARKGAHGAFRLQGDVVLHDGASHYQDGDDYSVIAKQILRDGMQLQWD